MISNADQLRARAIVIKLLEDGRTKADIASAIDYNRTSISRWINEPDYNGEHIAAKVLEFFDVADCPHFGHEISTVDCRAYALRSCPTSSTREVRHWRACQTCPNKPEVTK